MTMTPTSTPRVSATDSPVKRRPRALGARSAANRALAMAAGRQLSRHQAEVLGLTARLITHAINASNSLFHTSETRDDGEPRALLGRLLDLNKAVADNLRLVFPDADDGGDPFAGLRGDGG